MGSTIGSTRGKRHRVEMGTIWWKTARKENEQWFICKMHTTEQPCYTDWKRLLSHWPWQWWQVLQTNIQVLDIMFWLLQKLALSWLDPGFCLLGTTAETLPSTSSPPYNPKGFIPYCILTRFYWLSTRWGPPKCNRHHMLHQAAWGKCKTILLYICIGLSWHKRFSSHRQAEFPLAVAGLSRDCF